jgi:hypothetical protein
LATPSAGAGGADEEATIEVEIDLSEWTGAAAPAAGGPPRPGARSEASAPPPSGAAAGERLGSRAAWINVGLLLGLALTTATVAWLGAGGEDAGDSPAAVLLHAEREAPLMLTAKGSAPPLELEPEPLPAAVVKRKPATKPKSEEASKGTRKPTPARVFRASPRWQPAPADTAAGERER